MERIILAKEPERFIERSIVQFVQRNPGNRRKVDGGKYWDTPLVGFSSGDDRLFKGYKRIIGRLNSNHCIPGSKVFATAD